MVPCNTMYIVHPSEFILNDKNLLCCKKLWFMIATFSMQCLLLFASSSVETAYSLGSLFAEVALKINKLN
jgi:hypothetical protein